MDFLVAYSEEIGELQKLSLDKASSNVIIPDSQSLDKPAATLEGTQPANNLPDQVTLSGPKPNYR